jgi:drug/metabolite transporter (DMT)-like permease
MVIGQKVRSTVSNFSYVVIVFLLAGAIALCYALVTDQSLTVTEPNDWVGILLITFFGQIVVHALTNLYLKHGQAAILQLTGLAKIPLIALIGWIFFGQAVSLAVIPALLLTIAGLVVYNMAQTKRS